MSHYAISIRLHPRLSATNKRSLERAMKGTKPQRASYVDAIADAMRISKCNVVQFVVITHVHETSMGVWRKGKKS